MCVCVCVGRRGRAEQQSVRMRAQARDQDLTQEAGSASITSLWDLGKFEDARKFRISKHFFSRIPIK